eukprot:640274-Rhodomonas_salina.1
MGKEKKQRRCGGKQRKRGRERRHEGKHRERDREHTHPRRTKKWNELATKNRKEHESKPAHQERRQQPNPCSKDGKGKETKKLQRKTKTKGQRVHSLKKDKEVGQACNKETQVCHTKLGRRNRDRNKAEKKPCVQCRKELEGEAERNTMCEKATL